MYVQKQNLVVAYTRMYKLLILLEILGGRFSTFFVFLISNLVIEYRTLSMKLNSVCPIFYSVTVQTSITVVNNEEWKLDGKLVKFDK